MSTAVPASCRAGNSRTPTVTGRCSSMTSVQSVSRVTPSTPPILPSDYSVRAPDLALCGQEVRRSDDYS